MLDVAHVLRQRVDAGSEPGVIDRVYGGALPRGLRPRVYPVWDDEKLFGATMDPLPSCGPIVRPVVMMGHDVCLSRIHRDPAPDIVDWCCEYVAYVAQYSTQAELRWLLRPANEIVEYERTFWLEMRTGWIGNPVRNEAPGWSLGLGVGSASPWKLDADARHAGWASWIDALGLSRDVTAEHGAIRVHPKTIPGLFLAQGGGQKYSGTGSFRLQGFESMDGVRRRVEEAIGCTGFVIDGVELAIILEHAVYEAMRDELNALMTGWRLRIPVAAGASYGSRDMRELAGIEECGWFPLFSWEEAEGTAPRVRTTRVAGRGVRVGDGWGLEVSVSNGDVEPVRRRLAQVLDCEFEVVQSGGDGTG